MTPPRILEASEASGSFPLQILHSCTYVGNRCALVGLVTGPLLLLLLLLARELKKPPSATDGSRLPARRDAAHVVHPLAGQGLNLGLADVRVLADLLLEAVRTGQDIGSDSLLQEYQQRRRLQNSMMLASLQGMKTLFESGSTIPLVPEIRSAGLSLFSALPFLQVSSAPGGVFPFGGGWDSPRKRKRGTSPAPLLAALTPARFFLSRTLSSLWCRDSLWHRLDPAEGPK